MNSAFADRPCMLESNHIRFATQFFYAGTLFTAASAIGFFSCAVHRWPRRVVLSNVLLTMGLIAFVYALGRPGMAWGITGELPIFKQFRHPMKYLVFVHLFGILGGGLVIERLLIRFPRPRLDLLLAGALFGARQRRGHRPKAVGAGTHQAAISRAGRARRRARGRRTPATPSS